MRWTLIFGLGATGVLLAPVWLFAHLRLGPNWIYFAVALSFAALISRNTTSRRFLHGFIVGLMFFAVFGTATAFLWSGAVLWEGERRRTGRTLVGRSSFCRHTPRMAADRWTRERARPRDTDVDLVPV